MQEIHQKAVLRKGSIIFAISLISFCACMFGKSLQTCLAMLANVPQALHSDGHKLSSPLTACYNWGLPLSAVAVGAMIMSWRRASRVEQFVISITIWTLVLLLACCAVYTRWLFTDVLEGHSLRSSVWWL